MWLDQGGKTPPVALVTGGGKGFGLAVARELAAQGMTVFISGRDRAALEAAAAESAGLRPIPGDVTSPADRRRMIDEVEKAAGGPPDILVNNAGITRAHDYTNSFTLESDRASAELQTNLLAPVDLCRLWLDARRRAGVTTPGAIVNVGTPGALFPLEAAPIYSASKAGFHMFTLGLRRHLRDTPVKVMEVFPPALDTALADQLMVASQAANGPPVIKACAEATVAGILAGDEVILPHEQSKSLYEGVPHLDPGFADMVNKGVQRRPGWDAA
jgi:uncharacterized oxidoreductase